MIQQILEKSRVHNVKVVGDAEARERDIDVQAQVGGRAVETGGWVGMSRHLWVPGG